MTLFDVIDRTWPAQAFHPCGPFTLREGAGGGKRVSAASCTRPVTGSEIEDAESAMATLGQPPLFQVQGDQPGLDDQLAARGYEVVDPVVILLGNIDAVAGDGPPRVRAFPVWPILAIQSEIWADGGIGPARRAVMERARAPKTTILGRIDDSPAGCAFVALHDGVAMTHAVHVLPRFRRKGCAENMMRGAAVWARAQGAKHFAALTLSENLPARTLYSSLGMQPVGHYHYRLKSPDRDPRD